MSVVRPAVAPMTKPRPRSSAGPELVAGPLEAEHRVEDVERDEAHAVSRVGRGGGLQRSDAAASVHPLLQYLSVDGLAVAQHKSESTGS